MVKQVDVCTFGFLYSAGPVARSGDGPERIQKAKSAKNGRNQHGLPSVVMSTVSKIAVGIALIAVSARYVGYNTIKVNMKA